MPNRINGYNASDPLAAAAKGAAGTPAVVDNAPGVAASAASPPPGAADTVTLTGPALTLQKLSQAVAQAPVVNTQKVASVKQSLQNGSYRIDSGRVADKLLQFENGLK